MLAVTTESTRWQNISRIEVTAGWALFCETEAGYSEHFDNVCSNVPKCCTFCALHVKCWRFQGQCSMLLSIQHMLSFLRGAVYSLTTSAVATYTSYTLSNALFQIFMVPIYVERCWCLCSYLYQVNLFYFKYCVNPVFCAFLI